MKKISKATQSRSVETRKRLLDVGIEAFAHTGFEGVGTRELADRAGVNLSAIRYHFGDKKGLYRAVIQRISDGIRERVSPFIDEVRDRAERPDISREELIALLCQLITSFAAQLLGSGIPDTWARLVTREQVHPSDAFPIMYRVFRLLIDAAALVVGKLIGEEQDSERVRISVMTIVGHALVFRTHRATAMKFIGWRKIGPREIAKLQSIIADQCRAVMADGPGRKR